jgi:formylglycine-generating enzyme required for sulfatase activity
MKKNLQALCWAMALSASLWPLSGLAILPDEPPPERPKPAPKPKAAEKPKAAPRPSPRAQGGESTAGKAELLFWDSIKDSQDPADFKAYLEQYPHGRFARLARNRMGGGAEDQQHQPAASQAAKDCSACPEMVRIPSLGISMGKYEVTQSQWRAVMGDNPSHFSSCGDDCPVENVSWNEAQDFIQRLNQRVGKRFRLPTDEEWFAACQAGSSTEYCGSDNIDAVAWYESNSGERTHPVGQKRANAWGLHDMSGNVWEWNSSCYENDCAQRVNRGGSWYHVPASARSALRNWFVPTDRFNYLGFRLAQD